MTKAMWSEVADVRHPQHLINDAQECECECGWVGEVDGFTEEREDITDGFNGSHTQRSSRYRTFESTFKCPNCDEIVTVDKELEE